MVSKRKKNNTGCGCLFFGGLIFLILLFVFISIENRVDYRTEYIENTKYLATDVSKKYNLFPSVVLAQSALESNFGTSGLSSEYKNYFGIKAGKKDNSVNLNTAEFVDGKEVTMNEGFRKYNTKEESFNDYARLITEAKRYERVREASSYREAAVALYECGYATDPKYSEKIISIIEDYGLADLDLEVLN